MAPNRAGTTAHAGGLGSDVPYQERREAERFPVSFKLSVSVENPPGEGSVVSPAGVKNLSRSGVFVETRQALSPGQQVTLAIPTTQCPGGMRLPQAFVVPAVVMRVDEVKSDRWRVGMRFGDAAYRNMELMMFIDFLQSSADQTRGLVQ